VDRLLVMGSLVAVADTSSFAKAAEQMRTSASSVSRHVASLEKELGARLVHRTAHSVTLTEAGQEYSVFARRILGEIADQDRRLAGSVGSIGGPLSIVCPKWLGSLELGEAIADFAVQNPEVEIHLELGGIRERAHAFLESGFDVSFHTRPLRDSQMQMRRIAPIPFALVAAPAYLERRGRPVGTAALGTHDCLIHESESTWRLDLDGTPALHRITRPVFAANSYLVLRAAAVRGRGIALLPERMIAADLDAGTLERVLADGPVQRRTLAAVYAPQPRTPRRITALLDFVAARFGSEQA
jgi:DNA-binding transcriptional LysR family regulator